MTPSSGQITVMSFNIRYDNPGDQEDQWSNRKSELAQLISEKSPSIVGIQEGLFHQVEYIDSCLTNYQYSGVGREDAEAKGEFTAIFYDTITFELLSSNTYWLSESPDTVSIGWDAALERIVTTVTLMHRESGDSLLIFNAHFDHIGKESQLKSAEFILQLIHTNNIVSNPVIVLGDLNCLPESLPITQLRQQLDDCYLTSKAKPIGPTGTFNGFTEKYQEDQRIDYIFSKNLQVLEYETIDQKRANKRYISDHFPIWAQFK